MSKKNLLDNYNDSQQDLSHHKSMPNINVDQDLIKNRQKLKNII